MKTHKKRIFAEFISNLFAGASFAFLALIITISKICWDCPSYFNGVLLLISILGMLVSAIFRGLYKGNSYFAMPIVFLVLFIGSVLYVGVEDIEFVSVMALIPIGYSLVPAILLTVLRKRL